MNSFWGRVRPLVFRVIIGAVIAAGLVAVVGVLIGDFGTVALQLLLTILVVIVFALLSWYDADVSSKRSGAFALASVATSLYLLIAGFVKIWIVRPDTYSGRVEGWNVVEQFWQWILLVIIARAALLQVHLLLVIHRRYPTSVLQVVAKITVGVIGVLAFLLTLPVLAPHLTIPDWYWRLVWVLVILDLLGTVLIPLTNALFSPRHGREARIAPAPYAQPGGWSGPVPGTVAPAAAYAPRPRGGYAYGPPTGAPVSGGPAAPTAGGHVGPGVPGGPVSGLPTEWADAPTADGTARGAQPSAGPFVYEAPPAVARVLAWPRYVDGSPLPALPDGTPDFSGVERR